MKAASLFAIALARLALSFSLVGAWLEPGKLGSIALFGLAVFAGLLITVSFLRLLRRRAEPQGDPDSYKHSVRQFDRVRVAAHVDQAAL